MITFAGLADKVEGTVVPIDKPDMQVTTTRIPIGVSRCNYSLEFSNAFDCC
jgi:hypothetical protein